jgi:hypothetical protein
MTTTATHIISSEVLNNVITREKNNHGAIFTLKSLKTGKDYTYQISRSEFKGTWYTHIKVENNYMEFKRIGHYFKGNLYNKRQKVTTPTAIAIAYVLKLVEAGHIEWLDNNMELMHTGSCLVCGRTLTDANSIERGIGPTCSGH